MTHITAYAIVGPAGVLRHDTLHSSPPLLIFASREAAEDHPAYAMFPGAMRRVVEVVVKEVEE